MTIGNKGTTMLNKNHFSHIIAVLKPTWRRLFKIGSIILGIIGIIGTLYNFSPKLTIDSGDSLNPQDPFATRFSIKNDSIFSLYSIHRKTFIRKLRTLKDGDVIGDSSLVGILPPIPVLVAGEPSTFSVAADQIAYDSPYCYADIEIVVSFRPAFLPYRKTIAARFSTEKAIDGTLHWLPRAKSE